LNARLECITTDKGLSDKDVEMWRGGIENKEGRRGRRRERERMKRMKKLKTRVMKR
jgi:hypothetical protein